MIIPNIWKNKSQVPNHQPELIVTIVNADFTQTSHHLALNKEIFPATIDIPWMAKRLCLVPIHLGRGPVSSVLPDCPIPAGPKQSGSHPQTSWRLLVQIEKAPKEMQFPNRGSLNGGSRQLVCFDVLR